MSETREHVPVLLEEVLSLLDPRPRATVLDGTIGAGGHARALLERAGKGSALLGLDRDPRAIELAREGLASLAPLSRLELVHASYDEAPEVAARVGLGPFHAILLDLGVSSMQLDRPERGFTFQREGPLDMRMDPSSPTTAASIVNEASEEEPADLIFQLGEERFSRRIAREVVRARNLAPFRTTLELARAIERAVPRPRRDRRRKKAPIHPATRTFQALRIAVNEELSRLERALPRLVDLLAPGGRLAVISFHSLEDRPVKRFFRASREAGRGLLVTRRAVRAGEAEIARNPRARSARLRVLERPS
ncbi:16S rRNA (cytosine(1402)-N(4))-methyltransferase RsmH [bacterium]|nr:16S rRNA (cytosine(1402)-N(4))-methyltransferase RsmH [bacterium]